MGADKAYDAKDFVTAARALNGKPHITRNDNGRRHQHGRKDDPPSRLLDQPELPVDGRACYAC